MHWQRFDRPYNQMYLTWISGKLVVSLPEGIEILHSGHVVDKRSNVGFPAKIQQPNFL